MFTGQVVILSLPGSRFGASECLLQLPALRLRDLHPQPIGERVEVPTLGGSVCLPSKPGTDVHGREQTRTLVIVTANAKVLSPLIEDQHRPHRPAPDRAWPNPLLQGDLRRTQV